MLKIRLSRAGRKDAAFFRIVLTEHTAAAKHGYKYVLGYFNPFSKEFKISDMDKFKFYAQNWAQISPRLKKLMETNNVSL